MQVHKQVLGTRENIIPGRVIHVDMQDEKACAWYETDGCTRTYQVVLTGEAVPAGGKHRGTFLLQKGQFVGHLYEL